MKLDYVLSAKDIGKISPLRPPSGRDGNDFRSVIERARDHAAAADEGKLVHLGRISRQTPTVSDLLVGSPDTRKACWRIIHSDLNKDKPYRSIPLDTDIYIDSQTREVLWQGAGLRRTNSRESCPPAVGGQGAPMEQSVVSPSDLTEAVVCDMGKSYGEVDCYELIVRGLGRMGVQYHGAGGLKETLIRDAREKGLPMNAFLSGEGLVAALGRAVYQKQFEGRIDIERTTSKIYKEVAPLLSQGMILSFSMPTRGHTGLISQHGKTWTYVNSGRLDHDVRFSNLDRGVGEEDLRQELRNWVRRAARKHEPLKITLGAIDPARLARYVRPSTSYMPSTLKI